MKIKTGPHEVWAELEKGQQYKSKLNLYENVKQNESFVIGNQWDGVIAPDLEKPVLNFLRRIIAFFVSIIVSDDIAVSMEEFRPVQRGFDAGEVIASEVERVLELTKARSKNRMIIRNAAIDGDSAVYFWFDPDYTTKGRTGDGEIRMETVDNTKVIFGDPYRSEVQEQPYILTAKRCLLESARERMVAENPKADPALIQPDSSEDYSNNDEDGYVTTVAKLYKNAETGTIWYTEITRDAVIIKPRDLGYKLYPIAWMPWEPIKNSYHGQSAVTGIIPNQIFVNKLWAMFMEHQKAMAFPKVVYDQTKFVKGWTNRAGEAIGVQGDPRESFTSVMRGADFSAQAMELVEKTIAYTKEFMGASDAALGNVRPDNTSAIIAVQKASSAPLELQRMAYYQLVEDYIRIIIDMMCTRYGTREVQVSTEDNGIADKAVVAVNFAELDYSAMNLKVDIGASAYWSELAQMQTMDSLFAKGIIPDMITYLEGVPSKYVPNKNKLIEKIKKKMEEVPTNGSVPELSQAPNDTELMQSLVGGG